MKILKPIKKPKIKELEKGFFVLDTETTKLEPMPENFVFGVLYGYNFQKVFKSINDFKLEISKPKYKKKYIFAHNAEFDLLTLFGSLYTNLDSKAVFNGKFITAKYKGVIFADSLNIFPASVEKIGEITGQEKHINEKVKTNKLTKKNISKEDIEYCIQDCKIIYDALLEIFNFSGAIKLTIASLTMYVFRQKFLFENLMYNEFNDEFYESYYGGRTEAFYIGKTRGKVFDINSLYPFIMKTIKFPDVKNLKKETLIDVKYFNYLLSRFEGCSKVTIKHNDNFFGFLPYRKEKLLFPIGEFTTVLNFNEIRYALKHKVIEILKVEYAIYSNAIDSPFKKFIEFFYNERLKTENELYQYIYKLQMNSLYGRFAMREKYTTEYYNLIPYEIIEELKISDKFYSLKMFSNERNDCYLVTENKQFKNSFFAIPTFSSYITSEARIKLLDNMLNQKTVLYCDTDSIFIPENENFIGLIDKDIGSFKEEKKIVTEIRGLKNYTYIDLETNETIESIKGISKRSVKLSKNKYQNTNYYKTKEALRQNKEAGSKKVMIKELIHKYDKRTLFINGQTKPIKL